MCYSEVPNNCMYTIIIFGKKIHSIQLNLGLSSLLLYEVCLGLSNNSCFAQKLNLLLLKKLLNMFSLNHNTIECQHFPASAIIPVCLLLSFPKPTWLSARDGDTWMTMHLFVVSRTCLPSNTLSSSWQRSYMTDPFTLEYN